MVDRCCNNANKRNSVPCNSCRMINCPTHYRLHKCVGSYKKSDTSESEIDDFINARWDGDPDLSTLDKVIDIVVRLEQTNAVLNEDAIALSAQVECLTNVILRSTNSGNKITESKVPDGPGLVYVTEGFMPVNEDE